MAYLGEPPKEFRFQWHKYQPVEFIQSDTFKNNYLWSLLNEDIMKEMDVDLALSYIKIMIDQKKMPIMTIKTPSWACNVEDGFFSVDAYVSKCVSPSRLMRINQPEEGYGNHAVVVVDYILDKYGEISWMLIKNSWGHKNGDEGFFHMDRESFNQLFQVLDRPLRSL